MVLLDTLGASEACRPSNDGGIGKGNPSGIGNGGPPGIGAVVDMDTNGSDKEYVQSESSS